jgi:hypothetical protein
MAKKLPELKDLPPGASTAQGYELALIARNIRRLRSPLLVFVALALAAIVMGWLIYLNHAS